MTDFTTIFSKCWASSMATLEGASGLRSDQPGWRRVGKGDEFNKAAPAPQAPPLAPTAPARASGENGARPTDEPSTPPAGAGDPAPCEGVVTRPAASEPGRLQLIKNKAFIAYQNRCMRDLSIQEPRICKFEHAYMRIT